MKVFEIYRPILNFDPEELQVLAGNVQKQFGLIGTSTSLHWGSSPRLSSYRARDLMAEALNDNIDEIREVASTGLNGRTTSPNMRLWGFDLPVSRGAQRGTELKPRIELAERIGAGGRGSSTDVRLLQAVVQTGEGIVNSANRGAFRGDTRNLERGIINNIVLVGFGDAASTVTRAHLASIVRDQRIAIPRIELGAVEVSFCETDEPSELLTNYGHLA